MVAAQDKAGIAVSGGFTFGGRPDRQYYFAYGANMNPAQMAERCSRPVVFAMAKLPGHAIGFYGRSEVWDGALETVVPAPGQDLWGVIYELSFMDLQRLDVWQDARLDGGGNYFHYPAFVTDPQGQTHPVLLYKKDILGVPALPSVEYLERIIEGAVARGLPKDYCMSLRALAAKPASYKVPDRGDTMGELTVISSCAECGA
jgi:gamma-glutamylcyclotransferase